MDTLFGDAAERLFAEIWAPARVRRALRDDTTDTGWQACEDAGFADALVPEAGNGAGLALPDTLPLALAAGRHASPAPVVQTMLARAWLHAAGQSAPAGAITLAPFGVRIQDGALQGSAIPWARTADYALACAGPDTLLIDLRGVRMAPGGPHGSLSADFRAPLSQAARIADTRALPELAHLAGAACAALMAGAMDCALSLTLDYAGQRAQFGKAIGKFQAVQQQISVMAEHVWAARMAAQLAFRSDGWAPSPPLAALGKARASQAASVVADIAHAVHGAIGIAAEHDLHLYTHRLREWRLAGGSESCWFERIGAHALASGQDALDYLRTALTAPQAGQAA